MPVNAKNEETFSNAESAARKLFDHCYGNNWAGHDPYDALNSRIVEAIPAFKSGIAALIFTQLLKRSPVNLRKLLRVPKTQNPKGIALFISALLRAPGVSTVSSEAVLDALVDRLVALRSPGKSYWCWGYSFPWQGRDMYVPRWTPNLVCTQFAATAILDLYEQRKDAQYLIMAESAAQYILDELYWTRGDVEAGFSYPLPSMRNQVHNANFLAAALLCRVYAHTGNEKFLNAALKVARYSAAKQRADGSWPYGEGTTQGWADNFHTGYNLCALRSIGRDVGTDEFGNCIHRGFKFYRGNFFRDDGAPKYFHNRVYPLDIHCVAQSIITLIAFKDLDQDNLPLARSVLQWSLDHMWDERGFFYYRKLRVLTIRTSYMRWSQAWMFRALAELLSESAGAMTSAQTQGLEVAHKV